MFLGHYQLGDLVPISVWTRTAADTPTEPDDVPAVHVMDSDGDVSVGRTIPIVDRMDVTGYFLYRINLNENFAAGYWTVHITYAIGGNHFAETRQFEILAGGNAEGNGIAMYFFKPPNNDYVLMQTDRGTLKRLRNPSVRGI